MHAMLDQELEDFIDEYDDAVYKEDDEITPSPARRAEDADEEWDDN